MIIWKNEHFLIFRGSIAGIFFKGKYCRICILFMNILLDPEIPIRGGYAMIVQQRPSYLPFNFISPYPGFRSQVVLERVITRLARSLGWSHPRHLPSKN